MTIVTAAEIQKNFGKFSDLALREAVSITRQGRKSLVLLSADEYERLKSFDDRQVFLAEEIPDEWLKELSKPIPPYKTCLLYTSPSPRDRTRSRMPSSA